MPHEVLSNLEKHEIAKYNCNKHKGGWGYNETDGGEGALGRVVSEDTRQRISKALKGNTLSDEHRQKLCGENHPYFGKTLSEEHRNKISTSLKGRPRSEEHCSNLSEALKGNTNCLGNKHSDETRRKLSEAAKNPSDETRRKLSEAKKGEKNYLYGKVGVENPFYGKTHTSKTRQKMSEYQRNRTEEHRHKHAEAVRKPEYNEVKRLFLLLPSDMSIKEKRKTLYVKYPSTKQGTIRRWVRQWLSRETPKDYQ